MDDLPDKLRRNVVVLSAAIVAITVFHLSFQPTGTLLGFAQVGNVTPLKVWLALTAVLAYVFLRYWFHDETDGELGAMRDHYEGARYAAIQRCLTADAHAYLMQHSPLPRWIDGFAALEHDMFAQAYREFGGPASVELMPIVRQGESSPWSGEVDFTIAVVWPGGQQRGVSGMRLHRYHLPRHVALRIAAGAALRTGTYSKSAVDTLVPMVLAALAAVLCVYQLVRAGVHA